VVEISQKELRRLHELLSKWIDASQPKDWGWNEIVEARRVIEVDLRPAPPEPDSEES
jgi:hypothetical protein